MATVQAFRAIRPLSSNFSFLSLKEKLEPDIERDGQKSMRKHVKYLQQLLTSGEYALERQAAIYVYETTIDGEKRTGIWTLTDLEDARKGNIITHEDTLAENEEQIKAYRERVGLEGEPILLTYNPQPEVNELLEFVKATHMPEYFYDQEQCHKIWVVNEGSLISKFSSGFAKIKNVYLADGHHRLAAALKMHEYSKQMISTLYVTTDDLKVTSFHRVVLPENRCSANHLYEVINNYYYISAIPGNKPYCPAQVSRIGLYENGKWYQLDLKKEFHDLTVPDVVFLQEKILNPAFGIIDPRTDNTLYSFSAGELDKLLTIINSNQDAIAFTLFPMTINQLMRQADSMVPLPPKSTCTEPKVPFGLVMHFIRANDYFMISGLDKRIATA